MVAVKQELTSRNESVERVYGFSVANLFLVNRRYQRKLVWSIEEKRAFIDSLRQNFPVPLILLADAVHEGADRYEIIDGMQRLNAIVSFIEGEFDIDGKYFDLQAMAATKLRMDQGVLTQNEPVLEREVCVSIVGYPLPMTVYPQATYSQIDEIFRRINAYGKHLSRQELRVAGVTSSLSQLVRIIAAKVRGDVSASDKLYLGAMKQISITSKELPYGLDVDNIFWVKNNILTREYIRQSRDEELIADMLGYVLLDPKVSSSAEIIDEFFGYSPDGIKQPRHEEIENAVKKHGADKIVGQYMAVHEAVREIVSASGEKFAELMFKGAGQRVPRYYQPVFLALWELMIGDQMVIKNYKKAAEALKGSGQNIHVSGGGRYSADQRSKNVKVVKGLLSTTAVKRGQNDPAVYSGVTEFENILMQSYTEQSLYDMKQGFVRADGTKQFDDGAYDKVFLTLAAMANHGPGAVGYVIVGVADDKKCAKRLNELYGIKPVMYQQFPITGIDHEAALVAKGMDGYFLRLTQKIEACPMSPAVRNQVLRDVRLIAYFGRSIVVLRVEAGSEPCSWNGQYYERHGANVSLIEQPQHAAMFKRFFSKS